MEITEARGSTVCTRCPRELKTTCARKAFIFGYDHPRHRSYCRTCSGVEVLARMSLRLRHTFGDRVHPSDLSNKQVDQGDVMAVEGVGARV